MSKKGMVWLVGAGCGGRELLTPKALGLLHRCQVLVYDALIDPELLLEAPQAESLAVGKRASRHSQSQDSINELLIRKALEGLSVVRLKGGDPFVFGRGGEEAQALEGAGIPYEIVPGVTSAVAGPELGGIPVTHRGAARSFHVITAHTAQGAADATRYASLEGTLVFLMGLGQIRQLAEGLIRGGKSPDTPAAVISRAGGPDQRTVRGALHEIADLSAGLPAPAVIVVGPTAMLELSGGRLPLSGVSVTVIGTERVNERLAEGLGALGAAVRRGGVLRARLCDDTHDLDRALRDLGRYSWLGFASPQGVDIFFERMADLGLDLRGLAGLRLAALGPSTGERLRERGLIPDLISRGSSRALAEDIRQSCNGGRVLILRGQGGSRELGELLSSHGVPFDEVRMYELQSHILPGKVNTDYLVFTSPSGVRAFFRTGTLGPRTTVVCIGSATAGGAKALADSRCLTARESSVPGIISMILEDRGK